MSKTIIQMVTEIVTEFVATQSRWLSEEDIASVIKRVYRELKQIEALEARGGSFEDIDIPPSGVQSTTTDVHGYSHEIKPATSEPKIDPRESIQDDKIICVECGEAFKTLTHTHLGHHGLTSEEYKQKWGIAKNQPLTAKSVSERRKDAARERNVGEQLRQAREAKKEGKLSNPAGAESESA
jgi:predicted transcriptional regulator